MGRLIAAAGLAAAAVLSGCGGGDDGKRGDRAQERPEVATAEQPGRKLAIGITEQNPNFVFAPKAREVPASFDRWRDELGRMHPGFYRLVIDWAGIQPKQGRPPNLDAPNDGCLRGEPPCDPYFGVRDQLRALASRQKEGGWQALVVIAGSPDWAAQAPAPCEREGTTARNRPPGVKALPAYRKLVADLIAAAHKEGAELRYWAAWNEPNHPFSLSPQRVRCDADAPTVAVEPYVRLLRALRQALDDAPGDQRYVLGELAGLDRRKPTTTTIREFVRGLPKDLVCGTPVWTQHGYVGGHYVIDDAAESLAAKGCPREHAIWITETGVGAPRSGTQRLKSGRAQRRACRRLHEQLAEWYADPRVTAAFQYTLREDDIFPTGLVTTHLHDAYPALAEWQAWGLEKRPHPEDPPPATVSCGPAA